MSDANGRLINDVVGLHLLRGGRDVLLISNHRLSRRIICCCRSTLEEGLEQTIRDVASVHEVIDYWSEPL